MKVPLWPALDGPQVNYITPPPGDAYRNKVPRQLVILGSTGSIGQNAVAILKHAPMKVLALAAGQNIQLLARQANALQPPYLAVREQSLISPLRALLTPGYAPEILVGRRGYVQLASLDEADCVLSGQSGESGLAGTLAAVLAGKVVALANKESLVLAGQLIRKAARESGASILPVDSEHYAIFQCLAGRGQSPARIILTASGGPFLGFTRAQLENIGPEDALDHPNWKMGAKISIDSATLMNKGLEFIEAAHLFGVAPENIQILVHPQSIIHSLVQFADNSLLGQLAVPDMRLPIAGCLCWPDCPRSPIPEFDLASCGSLQFMEPDLEAFPTLALCINSFLAPVAPCWQIKGINPNLLILNAANEEAVHLFLRGKIKFAQIFYLVKQTLEALSPTVACEALPAMSEPAAIALAVAERLAQSSRDARAYVRERAGVPLSGPHES